MVHFWLYSGVRDLARRGNSGSVAAIKLQVLLEVGGPRAQLRQLGLETALYQLGRPEQLQRVGGVATPHGHRKTLQQPYNFAPERVKNIPAPSHIRQIDESHS
ncbi:hypothetical protein O6P43_026989 [Quillaja saponaria]|uniref:Uncharacterized protein n=1 Tax=Quillaja saponaria TaxID=32244 RepID=A0AAD7L3E4_QUISA|nr:hypothetical protein O6P43_026989 [Quillaja saponaria]